MNSRQIEQIAVNAVKDIFLQSEIFNPCIPDNDREPIWDGFIYIQNKNQTTIRIATQVKGKTAKKISFFCNKYNKKYNSSISLIGI